MYGLQQIRNANENAARSELHRALDNAKRNGYSYAVKLDELGAYDINLVPYIFHTQSALDTFIRGKGIRAKFQTYHGTAI